MSNNDIHLTLELNNRGSILISSGNYEEAIGILARALQATRVIMENTPVDQNVHGCQTPSLDAFMSTGALIATEESANSNGECKGYIYGRPIQVHDLSLAKGGQSTVLISVIIIFNLALAHHLLAMSNNESRAAIAKAIQLYKYAFELQRDNQGGSDALFTVTVLNILGLAYELLGDEVTAGIFFDRLLSTAMFLIDCGEGQVLSQFDGFFRNVSHLVFQSGGAAAA
jgi:tetratricopeptide (TPR) repeat protein